MWDRVPVDSLDLLLHPIRLRIVHAVSGGRTRTTSDLCARLPDVPKTTVYRHVALLADAGVLEVADEQRVHGAVERHYRLRRDRAAIDMDADSVGYRQGILWLSPDERATMIDALQQVLAAASANEPAAGRTPHLLSMIFFPATDGDSR
jgi:DNA-binding transcriptional ArsR family regulator